MSTITDSSRMSNNKSLSMLNLTVGAKSRNNSCKEKIRFPVKDPRMNKTVGNVFVEKDDILEDMLDEEALDRTRTIRAGLTGKQYNSNFNAQTFAANAPNEISKQIMNERRALSAHQIEEAMKKSMQKQIQHVANKKEQMYSTLVSDIEKSMSFLDSIDKNMALMEETKRNKTRRQFEDWNTQVHGSIQMDISKQINQLDSKQLNKKKNEDYSKFLEITNRKSAIFRDIIIESEYDPLEPNRRAIKAKTAKLIDPTKLDAQKAEEEGSMLDGKKTKQKLGKETLNVELWATGKIEATPYGVAAKMMGAGSAPNPNKAKTMRSNVKLDHFDYPKGKDSLDKEMPRGKRTIPLSEVDDTANRVFGSA